MCKRWRQPPLCVWGNNKFLFQHPCAYKLPPWKNSLAKEHKPTGLCSNCRCTHRPDPIADGRSLLSSGRSASGTLKAGSLPGGCQQKGWALHRHSASPVQLYDSVQPVEWTSAIKLKVVEEAWHWFWMTNAIAEFVCVSASTCQKPPPFSASTGSCGGKFPVRSYLITLSWLWKSRKILVCSRRRNPVQSRTAAAELYLAHLLP